MIGPDEKDDDLRRVLKRWEVPAPSAKLDERVWAAYAQAKPSSRWKWLPVAAALLLGVGIAGYWSARPGAGTQKGMDVDGFRPIPNGAITVVKTGANK
jgi:hypothetical protein